MKKFFNPVTFAQHFGFLLILFGIAGLLGGLINILELQSLLNRSVISNLLIGILLIIVGFGLRRMKKWSMYIMFCLTIYSVFVTIFRIYTGNAVTGLLLLSNGMYIGVTVRLFLSRKQFT